MFKKIFVLSLFPIFAMAQNTEAAKAASQAELNDAQIAKVLLTINEGEIDAGKMAQKKAQKSEVKDFAKMMVDDHKNNMKETKDLSKKQDFGTKQSDLAKTLEKDAKNANKDLKKSAKNDFDKNYLAQQIDMHNKALETLDATLIPKAQNAEFKAHLQKTRDAVASHLNHAKELQSTLQ